MLLPHSLGSFVYPFISFFFFFYLGLWDTPDAGCVSSLESVVSGPSACNSARLCAECAMENYPDRGFERERSRVRKKSAKRKSFERSACVLYHLSTLRPMQSHPLKAPEGPGFQSKHGSINRRKWKTSSLKWTERTFSSCLQMIYWCFQHLCFLFGQS